MPPRRLNPRKVLAASVGVATLNYLGSACSNSDGGVSVANLMAPPVDGGRDGARDSGKHPEASPTVANLVAPPPMATSGKP